MADKPYSKREQDEKWQDIANALSRIEIQTTTTNGRVSALEKRILIVSTAIVVIIALKFPDLLSIISLL